MFLFSNIILMVQLVKIVKATNNRNKYSATFMKDNDTRVVHFGSKGYGDFIKYSKTDKTLAELKKKNYIVRHSVLEDWKDPLTAGSLSRYILWNKHTLEESIKDYKARFNL